MVNKSPTVFLNNYILLFLLLKSFFVFMQIRVKLRGSLVSKSLTVKKNTITTILFSVGKNNLSISLCG